MSDSTRTQEWAVDHARGRYIGGITDAEQFESELALALDDPWEYVLTQRPHLRDSLDAVLIHTWQSKQPVAVLANNGEVPVPISVYWASLAWAADPWATHQGRGMEGSRRA